MTSLGTFLKLEVLEGTEQSEEGVKRRIVFQGEKAAVGWWK